MSVVGIVLAAGSSRRLGRPKQLLAIRGEPLVRAVVREALASRCASVIVVVGAEEGLVRAALDGLVVDIVSNPAFEEGMASSIRAGIARADAQGFDAALLMVCDQPGLDAAHIDRLLEAHGAHGASAASRYAGTLGVPAVFARRAFPALLALRGDAGAKALLIGNERDEEPVVAVEWPEGSRDIDTEADVARLV